MRGTIALLARLLSACFLGPISSAWAQSCDGAAALPAHVKSVTDEAEIVLDDDRHLLLQGIEIDALTKPVLLPVLRQGLQPGEAILYTAPSVPDSWGRYPAQVFLPPDGGFSTDWIQETIAAKGFSRALPGGPADCWARLLAAEGAARTGGQGIWRDARAAPVPAEALERLKELDGQRSLIFGRVASFGQGRAMIYLNFGEKRYDAFTLMISKRRLKSFARAGMKPSGLVGRRLRVRGVVLLGRQPRMEAYAPEDIELLDENGDGSR